MTPGERHERLTEDLTGLVRDVATLHRPDYLGDCTGCDPTPDAQLCIPWPCRTIRMIAQEMGTEC